MRNFFIIFILFLSFGSVSFAQAESLSTRLSGRIVLQVESKGEAWYIDPVTDTRIFLGRPADAFRLMRERGLGISNENFYDFQHTAPARLSGRILLQVELNGEAWYVNPEDLKLYPLGRPTDAFRMMRELGLGIKDVDLVKIREFGTKENGTVLQRVPFFSQAPFGEWGDTRQQDGCEEASSLMAVSWARGKMFTKQEARDTIVSIADFEEEKYYNYHDTSAADTMKYILNDYFDFYNAEVKNNVSLSDIRTEILNGNILIVPANGRLLHNPYFTQPGPLVHMLVVNGYDSVTKEFITNDPGTRHGESYRYDEDLLFEAIRDYPTGLHLPNDKNDKNIIIIKK